MKKKTDLTLDTHIWIWWIEQNSRLPIRLKEIIEDDNTVVTISSVSIYELLRAIARDRLQLSTSPDRWLQKATDDVNILVRPVTADIAATAARLPAIHGDPLDRLIIATALCHQSQLASLDTNFSKYPELKEVLIS